MARTKKSREKIYFTPTITTERALELLSKMPQKIRDRFTKIELIPDEAGQWMLRIWVVTETPEEYYLNSIEPWKKF